MKEIHLWNFIHAHLKKNNSIIITAVLQHEKGSPGKQGFKLVLSSNGDYTGSVGGGVMEYNALKRSRELLLKKIKNVQILETLYHNRKKSVKKSGLICSGSQTNLTFSFEKKDLKRVNEVIKFFGGKKEGKIIFSNHGFNFKKNSTAGNKYKFEYKSDHDWRFEECIGIRNTIVIAGCGHVGLAVSKLMSMLDFDVIVYDNRENLRLTKENIYADELIFDSYRNFGKILKENSTDFIVIVTTSFESDKEVLFQAISKKAKYIGLMGTKAKIKKIFNEVVKMGIKKEVLKKIHAPIGININSDTPEEIAVSIAAEIIKEKNID